ncbi:MAG: hypothetical protein AAGJ46_05190 [Planctomycetota bacterium]
MRSTLGALLVLLATTATTRGEFLEVPAAYTPGESFDFVVALPDVSDLANYSVSVNLVSAGGEAGVDFGFTDAVASPQGYVFASAVDFGSAVNTVSSTEERITLTDFEFADTNVTAPNNRLAIISVFTSVDQSDDLAISIDTSSLVLRSFGIPSGDLVPGFDAIRDELAAVSVAIPAIPEPATACLAALVAAACSLRRARLS